MTPSWQPDPTGRHDYRWWTGAAWSDQVGDRGVVSIDPGRVPADRGLEPTRRTRRRRTLGAVVLAAAALGAGVMYLLRPDGGNRFGAATLDFTGTQPVVRRFRLAEGEVVRFRVDPTPGVDARVAVTTEGSTALALAAVLAKGAEPADALVDRLFGDPETFLGAAPSDRLAGQVAIVRVDATPTGGPEAGWFVARVAGDYRIVVADAPPARPARFRTIVERSATTVPLDAEPGAAVFATPFFTETAFFDSGRPYEG